MKVAIIGAGISGLSCAYELAKRGITPIIYEKNSYIGNGLCYSSLWPKQVAFPVTDSVRYLMNNFDLEITPMEKLRMIEMFSPDKKMTVGGELGYIFRRGKDLNSLEKQLLSKLDIPIVFDSYIKVEDIREGFDKIVVATGNNLVAKQYNVWTDTSTFHVRVATALGSFDTSSIKVWFKRFCDRNFFCYLVPNNRLEASLITIIYGITHQELYYFWDKFISQEDIFYCITEVRDAEYSCGFASPLNNDKIYFIGNAGGFTDDFIGAGDFNAILSGIHAARAICENKSYIPEAYMIINSQSYQNISLS